MSYFFGSCESVCLARSSKFKTCTSTSTSYSKIGLPESTSDSSSETESCSAMHYVKNGFRPRKNMISSKSMMQSLRDVIFSPEITEQTTFHNNRFNNPEHNPNDEAFQLFSTKKLELPCSKESGLTIFGFLGFMRSFISGLILILGPKYLPHKKHLNHNDEIFSDNFEEDFEENRDIEGITFLEVINSPEKALIYAFCWLFFSIIPGYLNFSLIGQQFVSEYKSVPMGSSFLGCVVTGWCNVVIDLVVGVVIVFFNTNFAMIFLGIGLFEAGWIIEVENFRQSLK